MAQSLDPVSSIVARDLAIVHLYRRDFEAALEQCDHTIELNPHFSPAYWALGVIQEQREGLRRSGGRLPARHRSVAAQPARCTPRWARTLALSGKRELAVAALRKLDGNRAAALRVADRVRGDPLRARARSTRDFSGCERRARTAPSTCWRSRSTRGSRPLHDDRRFRAILVEIGLT